MEFSAVRLVAPIKPTQAIASEVLRLHAVLDKLLVQKHFQDVHALELARRMMLPVRARDLDHAEAGSAVNNIAGNSIEATGLCTPPTRGGGTVVPPQLLRCRPFPSLAKALS